MAQATQSVDDIIRETVRGLMARVAPAIAKAIAEAAAAGLEKQHAAKGPTKKAKAPARQRSRAVELTRWVADRRARRVPTFVIELTGLDTKKRLVAKYGENSVFEKGRPLPKPKADSVKVAPEGKAARVVSGK